jgi:creatinase
MISGYYTALERTLFLDHADDESLKAWEANVKVHKRGLELIKPGVKCSDICHELNELFAELGYFNIERLVMDILLECFHIFMEEKLG